jgi:hypothetical protein
VTKEGLQGQQIWGSTRIGVTVTPFPNGISRILARTAARSDINHQPQHETAKHQKNITSSQIILIFCVSGDR